MLEFIPSRQVSQHISEGWKIFSYNEGDYAAVMYAPVGWEPRLLDDRKSFKTCTIDGCNEKHKARGFCKLHYERFSIHGNPLIVKSKPKITCTEPGCDKWHKGHGLCATHLERARRTRRTFECAEAA